MDSMNDTLSLVFLPGQTMPHHETSDLNTIDPLILSILVVAVLFLILFVIIVTIFLIKFLKTQGNSKEKTGDTPSRSVSEVSTDPSKEPTIIRPSHWEIFSLEEKAVIDILIQNEGIFLQKNLPIKTDFSKATITRILSRLEEQDIIYRSPAGRGYRVFLKETKSL
ncbi:MAG: helix-turn-helix transcriptional regulator [Candidatus Hodarchaeales archaeon]|jgi:hypothetical protein